MFLSNCWFYSLVLYKPQQWNLEFWTYFSVIAFWCSAAKECFQTLHFKTWVLTQTDIENQKKILSNPKKAIFWFNLTGSASVRDTKAKLKAKPCWLYKILCIKVKFLMKMKKFLFWRILGRFTKEVSVWVIQNIMA